MLPYTDHVQLRSIVSYLDGIDRPVVVEVGAYTGAYACILGSLVREKGGRLLAIEPNPQNCAVMRESVAKAELGDVVTVEEVAVGNTEGMATISFNDSASTIADPGRQGVPVHLTTLRALLSKYHIGKIDVLMIDVEGAELPVLQGFPWGQVTADRIFCELHPPKWRDFGHTAADIDAFFAERGYLPVDMFLQPWPQLPDSAKEHLGPTLLVPIPPKNGCTGG
jgi:FkbM family methyltransferase